MEKFLLSEMKDKNFSHAVNEIYELTAFNSEQYPDYYKWFYTKNIQRIINKEGEVIFYLDEFQIIGISILKNTDEKKICTFLISKPYRRKGYSRLLLTDSFEYLETEKPLITIPEFKVKDFSKIINTYNWEQTSIIDTYNSREIEYNGQKKLIKN